MAYPGHSEGWRLAFKAPLYLWRMGLGPLLGIQFVVLTTTGRKSGLPRHTMTEYTRVNEQVVLASGWGDQAQWVKNLAADPHATVQTVHGTEHCIARRINDDATLTKVYYQMQSSPAFIPSLNSWNIDPPTLASVLSHKDRTHFYTFDPTDDPTPAPLETDLTWTWILVAIGFILGRLTARRK